MPRVNLTRQIKTEDGWKRVCLERDGRGRVRWGKGEGRYLIEWREGGKRFCYRFLHDRCKAIAKRAGLNPEEWHLHRFRDTAATRWLRGGIDVRTVQVWLGHESLDTTQKYLEPSTETQRQIVELPLPF